MSTTRWITKWDQRYATAEFVFGTEPNQFLLENQQRLNPGSVLCAGDGEGRNGVWLAQQGMAVTSVDYSAVGIEKARRLAVKSKVEVDFTFANILEYTPGPARFDNIVNIYLHMEADEIHELHGLYARWLKPGGILLAEVYSKQQLQYDSGGPRSASALYETEYFRRDFPGWDIIHLGEELIEFTEGKAHLVTASVVRAILRKPTEEKGNYA